LAQVWQSCTGFATACVLCRLFMSSPQPSQIALAVGAVAAIGVVWFLLSRKSENSRGASESKADGQVRQGGGSAYRVDPNMSVTELCQLLDNIIADMHATKLQNRQMLKEMRKKGGITFRAVLDKVQLPKSAGDPAVLELIKKYEDHPEVGRRIEEIVHPPPAANARDIDIRTIIEIHRDMLEWVKEAMSVYRGLSDTDRRKYQARGDEQVVLAAISEYTNSKVEEKYGFTEHDVNASVHRQTTVLSEIREFTDLTSQIHGEVSGAARW